ncbi:zinc finger protein, putative [Talaromyces stipitatus ATCC 10500]|uniref:Zinc finger protein, putative n=1 Tax=Talaromyces stipitatus (strain ATCC 10500 / CBS 375.48 / QM 6759 / NRRL 1006) TaxID=441959 RepID=B8M017_TALSN|nr:zinc finger protein, putative [Talaromyces stipitatus ATCC 10500]EED20949.1 zinc finger protein, putative [Talaromyces stipitatus ATCC 10500]
MSHSDLLFVDDEDGYHSDGSNLTEIAAEIRDNAESKTVTVLMIDQKELKSALHLGESQSALHLCNLDSPHNILDIGCGTGEWAIAIAEKYPSARVIGLEINDDLLPPLLPPNLTFYLGDHHTDLIFERRFDLIHIGHLDGCVRDWDALFRDIFRILKPGGYVECLEQSLTIEYGKYEEERKDAYLTGFIAELLTESQNRGMPLDVAPRLSSHLEKTGFAIARLTTRKIFFGDHGGLERRRFKAFADRLLAGAPDEVIVKAALAAGQLQEDDYMTLYWVSAQKPIQEFAPKVMKGYYFSGSPAIGTDPQSTVDSRLESIHANHPLYPSASDESITSHNKRLSVLLPSPKSATTFHECPWEQCGKVDTAPIFHEEVNFTNIDQSFERKYNLQRRYRIHMNERPYHCTVPGCNKRFTQRSALTRHSRTHTGGKPYYGSKRFILPRLSTKRGGGGRGISAKTKTGDWLL